MGTWGPGIFENDGALDYIGQVMLQLEETISTCLATPGAADLDEDGESVLVPSVALLSLLSEHTGAAPPSPELVREWREAYVAIFDEQIDHLDPAPGYKEARRQVIVDTFARLEARAREFSGDASADTADEEGEQEES
ncbi:MAG: DUF4259 domain-containing protein [Dehalococcoidia bacterium]